MPYRCYQPANMSDLWQDALSGYRAPYANDLCPLALKFLGGVLGDIAGDSSDGPVWLQLWVVEEGVYDGAALGTGGPEDSDDLFASHIGSCSVRFAGSQSSICPSCSWSEGWMVL